MKQNTNNLLVITRDDRLDDSYIQAVRKQRLTNVLAATTGFLSSVVEYTAEKLETAMMPVYLDVQDARLGTTLRQEYFEKRQHVAELAIRQQVGL